MEDRLVIWELDGVGGICRVCSDHWDNYALNIHWSDFESDQSFELNQIKTCRLQTAWFFLFILFFLTKSKLQVGKSSP